VRLYPSITVDGEFKALRDAGYTGSLEQISVVGDPGPFTWTIESGSLPSGFTLSGSGEISGTSSDTSVFSFTVRATRGDGDYVEESYSFEVQVDPIEPIPGATLSPDPISNPLKNQFYIQPMSVVGDPGPFTWSSNVSDGFSINPSTGVISGTTTLAYGRTKAITIIATRGDGDFVSENRTYRVEVPVTPYTWTMTASPDSGGTRGPGYVRGGFTGDLTSEPIAGHPIQNQWVSNTSGNPILNFNGDCTAIISSFTELVIDGTPYTLGGSSFLGGFTYISVSGVPQYVEGNTYSCELR
jgi:hypothetical protein